MCLILLAWQAHPVYQLVVASNRDEFFVRESQQLHWWEHLPVLAGKDISVPDGGTWLAFGHAGRFAAVTNVRDFSRLQENALTRGKLPVSFVSGDSTPGEYLRSIDGERYNGYNLLVSDMSEMWWASNWAGEPTKLEPGVYGLSNAELDTPWPKVVKGKERFRKALEVDDFDAYFDVLGDSEPAPDSELPATGLPIELERLASSAFIASPDYGTTASTVLRIRHDGTFDVQERRFVDGREAKRQAFSGEIIVG